MKRNVLFESLKNQVHLIAEPSKLFVLFLYKL